MENRAVSESPSSEIRAREPMQLHLFRPSRCAHGRSLLGLVAPVYERRVRVTQVFPPANRAIRKKVVPGVEQLAFCFRLPFDVLGKQGARFVGRHICVILKNPFYTGLMVTKMGTRPGAHEPLITKELFDRCQEVFRLKHTGGQPRHKLDFILAGKIRCETCGKHLVGERHVKKGKVYRYYRCHTKGCKQTHRAEDVERENCGDAQ